MNYHKKILRSQPRPGLFGTVLVLSLILLGITINPTPMFAMTQQLDFGSRGAEVSTLQRYLAINTNNYPSGLVTGYYGTSTQEGVQRFQTNQGIVSEGTPETTGYGRVGPITMARLNSLIGFTGGSMSTPASGDVHAPILSPEVLTTSRNAVTLQWNTNEVANNRVMYSTEWPFVYATAPSVTAGGYTKAARVTITGLQSNTTYYYVLESVDGAGNISWTVYKSFITL